MTVFIIFSLSSSIPPPTPFLTQFSGGNTLQFSSSGTKSCMDLLDAWLGTTDIIK